jgi:hypothetical protein
VVSAPAAAAAAAAAPAWVTDVMSQMRACGGAVQHSCDLACQAG